MAPAYYYSNPKDESEVVEVFQSMSETHEYTKNGVKWDRVWVNPQLNCRGVELDPDDNVGFIEKTGKMKGTYGDLIDYSAEMSEKRAEKYGEDPIKRKHFDDYEKKIGKKHLLDKGKTKTFENDFMSLETDSSDFND